VLGLIGVTLPVGTLVKVHGKRPTDSGYTYGLGGNSLTQRVMELPDGSRSIWWVLDAGLDEVEGIEFAIYNDVDGSALIVAAQPFEIGEAWIGRAASVIIDQNWTVQPIDPTADERTIDSQDSPPYVTPYRRLTVTAPLLTRAQAHGDPGDVDALDLEELDALLARGARCVAIPRYLEPYTTNLDALWLHRSAIFGKSKVGATPHTGGDYYTKSYEFLELPVPA
jgi:hypothetical protein